MIKKYFPGVNYVQNSDTIPDKHIERLFKMWIPRLAPDGDAGKAASAI